MEAALYIWFRLRRLTVWCAVVVFVYISFFILGCHVVISMFLLNYLQL
jgi:hypothetical protein